MHVCIEVHGIPCTFPYRNAAGRMPHASHMRTTHACSTQNLCSHSFHARHLFSFLGFFKWSTLRPISVSSSGDGGVIQVGTCQMKGTPAFVPGKLVCALWLNCILFILFHRYLECWQFYIAILLTSAWDLITDVCHLHHAYVPEIVTCMMTSAWSLSWHETFQCMEPFHCDT